MAFGSRALQGEAIKEIGKGLCMQSGITTFAINCFARHNKISIALIRFINPPAPSLEEHKVAILKELSCVLVFYMLSAGKLSLPAVCCNAV